MREFVREAYMLSDMRFQVFDLLVEHFGLSVVIRLLTELGGMRVKKSEAVYPGYLSLGPVLQRTVGDNWMDVFEVVGADVFTLPTLFEYMEIEKDIEAYFLVKYPNDAGHGRATRRKVEPEDTNRATKVRAFLEEAGLEL